ncbi:MAG: hypothetical protein AAGL89_11495 [Pseudomonadota bacterium]
MTDLNAQLLAAHAEGDKLALVTLYTQAADQARDTDTACFFLTHAFVFALEVDHADTNQLAKRLRHHGRL